jgi:hypothetical protein
MAEVELASALDVRRAELELAWRASERSAIRFRVNAVTLTVQAVARVENKVGGKVRWWLVVGGGRWRPVVFAGAGADLGAGVDLAGA